MKYLASICAFIRARPFGRIVTSSINSRITGTAGAEQISRDTPGRFLLKLDELTELQSPYLTLPAAKKLLEPYKVDPSEDVIDAEVTEVPEEPIFGVLDDD